MYLLENVLLLSGYPYGLHQNVYGIVLPEAKEVVLIDCGLDAADLAVTEETLRRWKLSDYAIRKVFITHSHFDHCGNAALLEKKGSCIYAGEKEVQSLLTGDEHTLAFCYDREFPVCESVMPVADGQVFALGEGVSLTAYETPGHSAGSICYVLHMNGENILFAGDFVQPGVNPGEVRLGIKVDPAYDYEKYVASVRKMMQVPVDFVFCGHYGPDLGGSRFYMNHAYRELLVNRSEYQN